MEINTLCECRCGCQSDVIPLDSGSQLGLCVPCWQNADADPEQAHGVREVLLVYVALPMRARPGRHTMSADQATVRYDADTTCSHGVAWDCHCCGCHSGFLFGGEKHTEECLAGNPGAETS